MSDLFHEAVPDAFIDRVFAVMALAPSHTFQILTKRAERMRDYFDDTKTRNGCSRLAFVAKASGELGRKEQYSRTWPLSNVWLGVSVENQHFADARIPLLLQTPAAVRFISAEPLLGEVNFRWAKWDDHGPHARRAEQRPPVERDGRLLAGSVSDLDGLRMLDWVIVGGESGPGARPFDLAWARSIVQQCQAAGTAVFVKQLGSNAIAEYDGLAEHPPGAMFDWQTKDRKGGDPSEWPSDLRVREFPRVIDAVATTVGEGKTDPSRKKAL
jgi:protein gp37